MELGVETGARPGSVACVGEWLSRGKRIKISETGNGLLLEMNPQSPKLIVVPAGRSDVEVWPMKWNAMRGEGSDESDILYLLELPTPTSCSLLVRRPGGDGSVIEFLRAGGRSRSRSAGGKVDATSSAAPASPGSLLASADGNGEVASGRDSLINTIKRGQRDDSSFKKKWRHYCDRHGNGFYDPSRHENSFLEKFIEEHARGQKRGKDGSRSASGSTMSRSGSRSSRSRSASKRNRRRRHRRHRRRKKRRSRSRSRDRRDRRKNKKKTRRRKKSRSTRSSSSKSGSEEENDVEVAENAVAEAESELAKAKKQAALAVSRHKEENQHSNEIKRLLNTARVQGEQELQSRLKEAEEKLLEEKATRLKEAEQRLDKAIVVRMEEVEKKLRKELDRCVEDAKRKAEEETKGELEKAERKVQKEAAGKIEDAETRLKAAKARLNTLKNGGTGKDRSTSSGEECDENEGGGASESADGRESPSRGSSSHSSAS